LGWLNAFSQSNPPWERPLKMTWSDDGINFTTPGIFQDSSGVPSLIRWKGDTLVCVFQWFRQPVNSSTWDKVAVKFSFNSGVTWTQPAPIIVSGIPGNFQRPFDPTLAVINNNSLRIYFSSSNGMPVGGLSSIVDTYSAISSDGRNFTFEPDARFDDAVRPVIDPAVIYFQGMWHYAAPSGAPQDGAFHCTSTDGIHFTPQSKYISDNTHNWTGNFMLNSLSELRFYGSGQQIWFNSSPDGFSWQGYINTNIKGGGDPSVVKSDNAKYLAVYVGEPYKTDIYENEVQREKLEVYPNPFNLSATIRFSLLQPGLVSVKVIDITGREIAELANEEMRAGIHTHIIDANALKRGIYILRLKNKNAVTTIKMIKQ
jgi:hypothetical protein